MISIFPLMSKYSGERNTLRQIYQKTFYYLLLMGIPISAVLTIFSREIIIFLYSEKYLASVATLQMLIWAGVIIFCSNLLGNAIVAINRQNTGITIASLGLLLNVGFNLYLIPAYNFFGAAIATVLTELFAGILLLIAVYFYGQILPFSYRLIKVFILSFLLSVSIIILKSFNLIISIAAIIPIYIFLLYVLKCYQEDFQLLEIVRNFLNGNLAQRDFHR